MPGQDRWAPPKTVVADAIEEMDSRKPATIWLLQAFILLVLAVVSMLTWDALAIALKGGQWKSTAIPAFMAIVGAVTLVMVGRRSVIGGWLGFIFVAGTLAVSVIGLYLADQQGSGLVRSTRNYLMLAIVLLPQVTLLIVLPLSRRVRHYYRTRAFT